MSKFGKLADVALNREVRRGAKLIERDVEINLNGKVLKRDTGQLAGSIRTTLSRGRESAILTIGTNVLHGRIWELEGIKRGAKSYPPRPFIRPAVDKNLPVIETYCQQAIALAAEDFIGGRDIFVRL
jgi:phage gpG-like protein